MKCRNGKLLSYLVALAVMFTVAPARAQTAITLDPSKTYQTIDGFGTCLSYYNSPAFETMYAQDLGASLFRAAMPPDVVSLFQPVELSADIDWNVANVMNFNNEANKYIDGFAKSVTAQRVDQMKVIGTIWTPPHWMKTNYETAPSIDVYNEINWGGEPQKPYDWNQISSNTYQPALIYYGSKEFPQNANSSGGHLRMDRANLTNFGRYVASYVVGLREKYGVNLYGLSLQNELRFYEPYYSAVYTPDEYVQAVKAVGRAFAEYNASHPNAPITTTLVGPEDVGVDGGWITDQAMSYINAVKADPEASKYMNIYALHGYAGDGRSVGGSRGAMADFANRVKDDGRKLYQTEQGGFVPQWSHRDGNGTQDGAIALALRIHDGLKYGNYSGWFYWQTAEYGPGGDPGTASLTAGEDTSAKKYNAAKMFFKFVRPGSVRIDSNGDDPLGLNVSAYLNNENHTLTVVMVNMGGDTSTSVALPPGLEGTSFTMYRTSATENTANVGQVYATGNSLFLTVPSESVVTLVGALPVPEPTGLLVGLVCVAWLLRRPRKAL
jgi:O-glycosyl hydrolase